MDWEVGVGGSDVAGWAGRGGRRGPGGRRGEEGLGIVWLDVDELGIGAHTEDVPGLRREHGQRLVAKVHGFRARKRLQGECPGRREEAVLLVIGRVVEHLLVCPALGAAVLGRNLIESTASARDFLPLRVSHKRKWPD